jgi:hypothetical protein
MSSRMSSMNNQTSVTSKAYVQLHFMYLCTPLRTTSYIILSVFEEVDVFFGMHTQS